MPVNGIVPGLPPAEAAERAVASGCGTLKIKVAAKGESLDDDIARVAALGAHLPADFLRGDIAQALAREGWNLGLELRAGSHHSALETEYFFERAFPRLRRVCAADAKLLWRADSGFDSARLLFALADERDRWSLEFRRYGDSNCYSASQGHALEIPVTRLLRRCFLKDAI